MGGEVLLITKLILWIRKVINMGSLWHGGIPPMGPPSPPYPPLYTVILSYMGDNPLNNSKINFGKNCSPTHKCGGGIILQMYVIKVGFGGL
jgi:hypothetical protein